MKNVYFPFLLFSLLVSHLTKAQSIPAFDLYPYNYSQINPAYTGAESRFKFAAQGRAHHWGTDFSSSDWMLAGEVNLKKLRSGIGFMATQENNGLPYLKTRYSLNYSYAIPLKDSSQLRIGTNLSVNRLSIEYSKYDFENDHDIILYKNGEKESGSRFNVGVGVWYSRRKLFAGLSIDYLYQPTLTISDNLIAIQLKRNYQVVLGWKELTLSRQFSTTPSLNFSTHRGYWEMDINNTFAFRKIWLLGITYRTYDYEYIKPTSQFIFNGGVKLLKHFQIMGTIYSTTPSNAYTSGFNGELLMKITY
ncbi:MAG: PorP/SprF family type IX secretion system membrane protein [Bacteroidota bacterium]